MPWMTSRIEVKLDLTEAASHATFTDAVELSLDCPICEKRHRTVTFSREGAQCSSAHSFPGQILETNNTTNGVIYTIGYWYNSFRCKKMDKLSQPGITWGRVGYLLFCKCKTGYSDYKKMSVQTNLVRPYEISCCNCGKVTMSEKEVYPKVHN